MPARRKSDPASGNEFSFEDCLADLETIVDSMENDRLPLEELVARYEKGSELLRRCETILSTARERIELINLRSRAGETEAAPPDSSDFPPEPNDDIRLF